MIAAVFLVALAIRAFYLAMAAEPFVFAKYPYFAEKLVKGEDIGERILDLSPGYLYFTAAFNRVFGSDWTLLRAIQSVIGAVVSASILVLGTRLFNPAAALMAALLYAGYGTIIVLEATHEPLILMLLLNIATVIALESAGRTPQDHPPQWPVVIGCGLLAGASIVVKADFLLFLPLGAWWLYGQQRSWRPRAMMAPILFVVAAMAVVAPVTIRNYLKFNDFILLTADAGKVFYHGNGKGATALNWTGLPDEGLREEGAAEPDHAHVLFRRAAEQETGRALKPSQASRYWAVRALSDMAAEPATAIKRLVEKLCFFFNDYELTYIASVYKEYKNSLAYPFVRFGWIAALALVGMVLAAGRFRRLWLVYAMVGVYLVSCLAFIVQARYRAAALPCLCLFGGHALDRTGRWLQEKRFRPACLTIAAVLTLAAGSFFVFAGQIKVLDRWQTATKIHYQLEALPLFGQGKYPQALEAVERAIALEPGFGPAWNLKGKIMALSARHAEARHAFATAIRLSPAAPAGYENLGLLLLLDGNPDAALPLLKQALELGSTNPKVRATTQQTQATQ